MVPFVIDLKTRRVHIAGITNQANGEWMAPIARNLSDAVAVLSGALAASSSTEIRSIRSPSSGCLLRRTCICCGPPTSPNLNAYAERFVRSIRQECLRHIIPLGVRHLRHAIDEFAVHYHSERNHQGLANVIPFPSRDPSGAIGRIRRHERLGGLLKFYERKAA